MKHAFRLFLLISFLFSFISCEEKVEIPKVGSVHGIVTDKVSGEPVSGASITISPLGKSTTTGTDGRYEYNKIDVGQYTVQAIAANYETNSKGVSISDGSTSQCDIQLTPATPVLKVSLSQMTFDKDKTTLPFNISNAGQSTLSWSATEGADWLICEPASGNTTTEPSTVNVIVDRAGKAGGEYSETISITSNGGSATIKVIMEVENLSSILKVTPDKLDFSYDTDVIKLTLTNAGSSSAVEYKVQSSNDWLIIEKDHGTVTTTDYLNVSVNRSAFDDGHYNGTVTIIVGDNSTVIPATVEKKGEQRPTVNISGADAITYNSMTLKGSIISIGTSKVTNYGFCWSTSTNPTIGESSKCNLGDCSEARAFQYIAQNLEADTKYYVKAYAINKVGVSYSPELEFTTEKMPTVPTVSTGEPASITASSTSIPGTITSLGNVKTITQHGHVWSSTSDSPTITLSTKTELGECTSSGTYTSDVASLEPNTLYYIRAYATNEIGTSYGETKSFTTKVSSPVVITNEASDITKNGATLNGNITNNGGGTVTEYGFLFGTSESSLTNDLKNTGNKTGTFKHPLSDLASSTTYYFKAYARNENGISYGEVKSFSTSSVSDGGTGEDFNDNNW